jgi:cytochrome c-type biogenesis protein
MAADVGVLAAFGGGIVSFASPCVLPLVPAYLSVVTGLDFDELGAADHRHLARIARDTGLFVAGFTAVFVALGVSATAIGETLLVNRALITRISGGVMIALALLLVGSAVLGLPSLSRELRVHLRPSRFGAFAAPIAGAAFGFGWTPCIGPILGSVLVVAATQRGTASGALLLVAYSLGLGVPFLLVGLGFGRAASALAVLRRHTQMITVVAACLLCALGGLLVADRLTWLAQAAQSHL